MHLTETRDEDKPVLITHVETAPAPIDDGDVTPHVHRGLEERELSPGIHVVDTAYLDAELMVRSKRERGVELIGPAGPDAKWQATEGEGFDAQSFAIDWEHECATQGTQEHQLDTGGGQAHESGDQGQVLDEGLQSLL